MLILTAYALSHFENGYDIIRFLFSKPQHFHCIFYTRVCIFLQTEILPYMKYADTSHPFLEYNKVYHKTYTASHRIFYQ